MCIRDSNSIYADNIIKTALLEDINYLDTTTDYLIDEEQEDTAKFLSLIHICRKILRISYGRKTRFVNKEYGSTACLG